MGIFVKRCSVRRRPYFSRIGRSIIDRVKSTRRIQPEKRGSPAQATGLRSSPLVALQCWLKTPPTNWRRKEIATLSKSSASVSSNRWTERRYSEQRARQDEF